MSYTLSVHIWIDLIHILTHGSSSVQYNVILSRMTQVISDSRYIECFLSIDWRLFANTTQAQELISFQFNLFKE